MKQTASNSGKAATNSLDPERKLKVAPVKKKKSVRDVISDDQAHAAPHGMISAPPPSPLRVTGYCTAENYQFERLFASLKANFDVQPFMADDICHVKLRPPIITSDKQQVVTDAPHSWEGDAAAELPEPADVFFFSNGTFVTWAASEEEIDAVLNFVKPFETNSYQQVETEWFDYFFEPSR